MTGFAKWLKKSRLERNFSQQALASKLGISVRSISRMEAEDGEPNANNLRRIAEFFGEDADALLGAVKEGKDIPVRSVNGDRLLLPGFLSRRVEQLAGRAGAEPTVWLSDALDLLEEVTPKLALVCGAGPRSTAGPVRQGKQARIESSRTRTGDDDLSSSFEDDVQVRR